MNFVVQALTRMASALPSGVRTFFSSRAGLATLRGTVTTTPVTRKSIGRSAGELAGRARKVLDSRGTKLLGNAIDALGIIGAIAYALSDEDEEETLDKVTRFAPFESQLAILSAVSTLSQSKSRTNELFQRFDSIINADDDEHAQGTMALLVAVIGPQLAKLERAGYDIVIPVINDPSLLESILPFTTPDSLRQHEGASEDPLDVSAQEVWFFCAIYAGFAGLLEEFFTADEIFAIESATEVESKSKALQPQINALKVRIGREVPRDLQGVLLDIAEVLDDR